MRVSPSVSSELVYMHSFFALTTRNLYGMYLQTITAFIPDGPDTKFSPSNTKSRTTLVIIVLLPLLSRPRQSIRGMYLSNDQR